MARRVKYLWAGEVGESDAPVTRVRASRFVAYPVRTQHAVTTLAILLIARALSPTRLRANRAIAKSSASSPRSASPEASAHANCAVPLPWYRVSGHRGMPRPAPDM